MEEKVITIQANIIDRNAKMNGSGWSEGGVAYTVNTIDRHAVCYDMKTLSFSDRGGVEHLQPGCGEEQTTQDALSY